MSKLDLDNLINSLQEVCKKLNKINGKPLTDLKQENNFAPSPILHQDTDDKTEQENAQFELDHPEESFILESIKNDINNILNK